MYHIFNNRESHMSMNTSALKNSLKSFFWLSLGCLLLLSLVSCGPSSRAIRDGIFASIDAEPNFGSHEITVDARAGVVTLTGEVASEQDRRFVYNAARREPGVVEVRDQLHVREAEPAPLARMSSGVIEGTYVSQADRDLVSAIEYNLQPLSKTHSYNVRILARDGYVTVTGTAGSRDDADAIISAMRSTNGVNGVTNKIEITPGLTDASISRLLDSSLASDSEVNMQGITYEVQNGVVTFRGRVNSHERIDRILSKALMTPGVREVRSEVTIVN